MRVLFCPLASPGFVYPMIGMARLLKDRGHRAAFATDQSFAQELELHGYERIPRGPSGDGPSFLVSHWAIARWSAIQVKHLEYALDSFQPDLLVGQSLTLGALIAAERARLPLVILGFCTYHWPRSRRALDSPASEHERILAWRLREWTDLYNEVRRLFRLAPVVADVFDTPALGDRMLIRSIPGFGIDDPDVPPRAEFVGHCLWEPEGKDDELGSWLRRARDSGKPVVYLQNGQFSDFPGFWSAFRAVAQDMRVAVSTGRMDYEIGEYPPDWLVRPFLPQGEILEHADFLVTAGNTTAVLGAIKAGVPALVIPGGGEQPDVAAWCEQAGMGKVLSPPEAATRGKMLEGIQEILADAAYRQHAALMRDRFAPYDGFDRAVTVLEDVGRSPSAAAPSGRASGGLTRTDASAISQKLRGR